VAKDLKYGQIDIPGIGDDEPVFVLRGRDSLALTTLEFYTLKAEESDVGSSILDGLDGVSEAIYVWQQENGQRLPA
jgi:hypothetical protein